MSGMFFQDLIARLETIGPRWSSLLPPARGLRTRQSASVPRGSVERRGASNIPTAPKKFELVPEKLWHDICYEEYSIEVFFCSYPPNY